MVAMDGLHGRRRQARKRKAAAACAGGLCLKMEVLRGRRNVGDGGLRGGYTRGK